jgi:hypothetical protein
LFALVGLIRFKHYSSDAQTVFGVESQLIADPELLTIETDHPCVPVRNEITSNVYCHKHSMNLTGVVHGFINAAPATIKSWFSTMSDNKQYCDDE